MSVLHLPSAVEVTPDSAGWERTGLRIVEVPPGRTVSLSTGDTEVFVLPLAGPLDVEVTHESGAPDARFTLTGRASVFTAVSDFCYAGRDSTVALRSIAGAQVAVPSARCTARLPARYGPAEAVPVEVRGAGAATRQVTNFGVPGVWDHAEKLMCCELITPPGNWSSYPPHKHDASEPCAVVNEEIYYYRVAGADQATPDRVGFGLHRTYTGPEHEAAGLPAIDELVEVRDGDVVLVPYGYHGPSVAAPGYPLYYLNVLAGAGDERSMAFCDDPAHAWVRDSWTGQSPDSRAPMTSSDGECS